MDKISYTMCLQDDIPPKSILGHGSPLMNLRMSNAKMRKQNVAKMNKAEMKNVYLGFVNARTIRMKRTIKRVLHTSCKENWNCANPSCNQNVYM